MADDHHPEIVIIRRGGHGDHDEHHGGVWKIAFADFMTAMMAFFLVMWLISANDKTRASVARYFNPVRLVDATTQPRGLHDTKKDESGITASPDNKKADDKQEKAGETQDPESKQTKGETAAQREARLDVALSRSPFTALAEIAKDDGRKTPATLPAAVGRRGGEAYRDPFAPPPPARVAPPATAATPDADAAPTPPPAHSDRAKASAGSGAGSPARADDDALHATAAQVKAALAAFKPQGGREGPQVDIKRTDEGLLVSFTDTDSFSMFSNGSAVPARRLVLMMERVGTVLKDVRGTVIVRGYTDSKPYRSGRYDNWHLSLDRAQVTHYMLVRGGLDDARIGHVEGYADRGPKAGIDRSSPLNRRIEILVKERS